MMLIEKTYFVRLLNVRRLSYFLWVWQVSSLDFTWYNVQEDKLQYNPPVLKILHASRFFKSAKIVNMGQPRCVSAHPSPQYCSPHLVHLYRPQ